MTTLRTRIMTFNTEEKQSVAAIPSHIPHMGERISARTTPDQLAAWSCEQHSAHASRQTPDGGTTGASSAPRAPSPTGARVAAAAARRWLIPAASAPSTSEGRVLRTWGRRATRSVLAGTWSKAPCSPVAKACDQRRIARNRAAGRVRRGLARTRTLRSYLIYMESTHSAREVDSEAIREEHLENLDVAVHHRGWPPCLCTSARPVQGGAFDLDAMS